MENNTTRRYCKECGKEVHHKDTSIDDGIVRHERCAKRVFAAIKKAKIAKSREQNAVYYMMLRKHKRTDNMNIMQGLFWLMLTVYHEARGECDLGQRNVVKVILNRADKKGWPIENIVLSRKQFSCFNKGFVNNPDVWVKNIPAMANVTANVLAAISEWEAGGRLKGATHYYAIRGMADGKPPYWASSMEFICEIEGHRFLKEV